MKDVLTEALALFTRRPLSEMADAAVDKLVSDDGLSTKAVRGKLKADGSWRLHGRLEYLEGPHGEPDYASCKNCGRQIRYVCHLTGDEGDFDVGPDCAQALLPPGKDLDDVIAFVGGRRKRVKFVRDMMKWFSEIATIPTEELSITINAFNGYNHSKNKYRKPLSYVQIFTYPKNGEFVYSIGTNTPMNRSYGGGNAISRTVGRLIVKSILAKHPQHLVKALELAFDEDKMSLKDKEKYFFSLKESGSPFIEDHAELLLQGIGQHPVIGIEHFYISLPDA